MKINLQEIEYFWKDKNNHIADRFLSLKYYYEYTDMSFLKTIPYKEFLLSDYWDLISSYVRWKNDYICSDCGMTNKQLDVHHKTYDLRGCEIDDGFFTLKVLCHDCHLKKHKLQKDRKY